MRKKLAELMRPLSKIQADNVRHLIPGGVVNRETIAEHVDSLPWWRVLWILWRSR